MSLSPNTIYEDFRNDKIDGFSATELLISLIENSDSNKIRVDCIDYIKKIGINEETVFKFLENLLISDSSEKVRIAAIDAIKNQFLEKALTPMMWAIQNETSIHCVRALQVALITVLKTLVEENNPQSKSILINEISKIVEPKFKNHLYLLYHNEKINDFSSIQLAQILIDYFATTFLKKQFQKINFELENGAVVELDLRFRYFNLNPKFITTLSPLSIVNLEINFQKGDFRNILPLSHLKKLTLNNSSLEEIPEWITSFSSLESLYLQNNQINSIPDWISSVSSLRNLGLSGNKLKSLIESLKLLKSLEYLGLSNNKLKMIPEWIGSLTSLKKLWLDDNKLSALPDSISNLTSLSALYLGNNNLKSLSGSFKSLNSLKSLWLERNDFTAFPESLSSLSSLEFLCLNDNNINIISESIGSMVSLKILQLNNNHLSAIPESIGFLKHLKELWLRGNNIENLPESIEELQKNGIIRVYL